MPAKKKSAAKKKTAKQKTATAKAAAKKTAAKKAPVKKATTAKKATAQKKTVAKKAAPEKAAEKKVAAPAPATPAPPPAESAPKAEAAPKKKGAFSSLEVNMGHVFSLRPRVATSFRPNDFREARLALEEDAFANAQEAARAVAEKALELTRGGGEAGRKGQGKRRF